MSDAQVNDVLVAHDKEYLQAERSEYLQAERSEYLQAERSEYLQAERSEYLQAERSEYRTRPFLAGQWGGVLSSCHTQRLVGRSTHTSLVCIVAVLLPVQELSRLYEAFATLTPGHVIGLRVRGHVHSALTGGPLVLRKLTNANLLLHGFVEVRNVQASDGSMEWQSVYPDNDTWQEVELRTVEKELDKQKEGTQCTTCSS